jgi:hypothetical protein
MYRIAADREGTRGPEISGNRTSKANPTTPKALKYVFVEFFIIIYL